MRDLVARWQRGWCAARELPPAGDVGGALRTHCLQPGRDVEYVALDDDPALLTALAARVAAERDITWLTVATTEPARAVAVLETAGLTLLRRSELLMTIALRDHPRPAPADPYRVVTEVDGAVVRAEARDESGEAGARGTMGLSGADAIADRIETRPAHRRRGLASAIMGALAATAAREQGILIASEDGQRLYRALGWRPVAGVLIATTPGNDYPL